MMYFKDVEATQDSIQMKDSSQELVDVSAAVIHENGDCTGNNNNISPPGDPKEPPNVQFLGGGSTSAAPVTLIAKDFSCAIRRPTFANRRTFCPNFLKFLKGRGNGYSGADASAPNVLCTGIGNEDRCDVVNEWESRDDTTVILKNISLCVRPGEMLVIMGPSGSGKTTLLNTLAGRTKPSKTVLHSGHLYYEGSPPYVPLSMFTTYIMQKDKVPEFLTVGEYVRKFAIFKMPNATPEERENRCIAVLKSLNLLHRIDCRIGGSLKKILSGGEIKRLVLAIELLNNPSVIFLDEPTSGLDASLAYDTMQLFLELARNNGRTVVCTIHQPRSQLFGFFDKLLVLNRGEIVFQGAASECCNYFASHGFNCPPHFNPADFLMDIFNYTDNTQEHSEDCDELVKEAKCRVTFDPAQVARLSTYYIESDMYRSVQTDIKTCLENRPSNEAAPKGFKKFFNANTMTHQGWCTQLGALLYMHSRCLLRNPLSCMIQFVMFIVLALIFGVIFFDIPANGHDELAGRSLLGALIFLSTQLAFSPIDSLVVFAEDRELFNRDTANGNYSSSAFFVSKSLSNLPFQHGPATILMIIVYWMIGLSADAGRFFIFLLVGQIVVFSSSSLLFVISAAAPRLAIAQAVAPVLFLVMMLVSGFYILEGAIPVWISWAKWLSFIRYAYTCFAQNEFNDNPRWANLPPDFLSRVGGATTSVEFWPNVGILVAIAVTLRIMAGFALKYCNRSVGTES